MAEEIKLRNVTLCAIVRDEIKNPAGGIVRFIERHVPHVGEARIYDTGSIDGTFETLKDIQPKYKNMIVRQTPFGGYAESRNVSIQYVKTKFILVLDADEVLTEEDFRKLDELLKKRGSGERVYRFDFEHILPDGKKCPFGGMSERLFPRGVHFEYSLGECLDRAEYHHSDAGITIKHFLPSKEALVKKRNAWYEDIVCQRLANKFAPSQTPSFSEWKELNPQSVGY